MATDDQNTERVEIEARLARLEELVGPVRRRAAAKPARSKTEVATRLAILEAKNKVRIQREDGKG